MSNYLELYSKFRYQLDFYFVARLLVGPVIEALIIIDRLAYLKENGVRHSYLLNLFDPKLSPRSIAIIASKKDLVTNHGIN